MTILLLGSELQFALLWLSLAIATKRCVQAHGESRVLSTTHLTMSGGIVS